MSAGEATLLADSRLSSNPVSDIRSYNVTKKYCLANLLKLAPINEDLIIKQFSNRIPRSKKEM